jgi:hypothetical protein
MSVVRTVALSGGVLMLILGCSGMSEQMSEKMAEKVMEATDAQVDMNQGSEATFPSDFPLPQPSAGTLQNTMTGSMAGNEVTTLTYELPQDADLAAIMAPYKGKMEEMGFQISEQSSNDSRTVYGMKDQEVLSATATTGSLILMSGKTAAPPPEPVPSDAPATQ